MILNEKELEVCLIYALKPLIKQYDFVIKESCLKIRDKIILRAVVVYQNYPLDLKASFDLKYENNRLCFQNIEGKVEYLFLQFHVMSLLQQFVHAPQIIIDSQSVSIDYPLPISQIDSQEGYLSIQLDSDKKAL